MKKFISWFISILGALMVLVTMTARQLMDLDGLNKARDFFKFMTKEEISRSLEYAIMDKMAFIAYFSQIIITVGIVLVIGGLVLRWKIKEDKNGKSIKLDKE